MRVQVNLLPWREQHRLKRRRRFVTMLALTLVVAVCVTLLYATDMEKTNRMQKTRQQTLQQELIRILSRVSVLEELREEISQLQLGASTLIKVHMSMVTSTALLQTLSSFQNEHGPDDTGIPSYGLSLDATLTDLHFDGTRLRLDGQSGSGSGVLRLSDSVSGIAGFSIPDESTVSLLPAERTYQFRLGFAVSNPRTGTSLQEIFVDDE